MPPPPPLPRRASRAFTLRPPSSGDWSRTSTSASAFFAPSVPRAVVLHARRAALRLLLRRGRRLLQRSFFPFGQRRSTRLAAPDPPTLSSPRSSAVSLLRPRRRVAARSASRAAPPPRGPSPPPPTSRARTFSASSRAAASARSSRRSRRAGSSAYLAFFPCLGGAIGGSMYRAPAGFCYSLRHHAFFPRRRRGLHRQSPGRPARRARGPVTVFDNLSVGKRAFIAGHLASGAVNLGAGRRARPRDAHPRDEGSRRRCSISPPTPRRAGVSSAPGSISSRAPSPRTTRSRRRGSTA